MPLAPRLAKVKSTAGPSAHAELGTSQNVLAFPLAFPYLLFEGLVEGRKPERSAAEDVVLRCFECPYAFNTHQEGQEIG